MSSETFVALLYLVLPLPFEWLFFFFSVFTTILMVATIPPRADLSSNTICKHQLCRSVSHVFAMEHRRLQKLEDLIVVRKTSYLLQFY